MATVLIAGKVVFGLVAFGLVTSIKTHKSTTKIVTDYRENPEVLDEVLRSC